MEKQVLRILSKLYRNDNRCTGENYKNYSEACLHLGHLYYEPKYVYLNLKYFAEQPDVIHTEYDIAIFRKLIELIRNAPDDERPSQCKKRLKSKKFLPSSMTIRAVLQTLSLCGFYQANFGYFSLQQNLRSAIITQNFSGERFHHSHTNGFAIENGSL